jgi:hypothetical protein
VLARVLVLALCCSLLSCKDFVEKYKRSSSGVSSLDKKLLFDFRSQPGMNVASGAPCPPAPASCSAVLSDVEGSFTYAVESEKACLYRCGGSNTLEVFSHDKLQAASDTPYSAILQTFDLNHDDKNELLLVAESANNGEISREASLQVLEKNTLRTAENFGIVYHDACSRFTGIDDARKKALAAQGVSPYVEALVISYLPRPGHQMPSFTAERYRAACPTPAAAAPTGWQLVAPK